MQEGAWTVWVMAQEAGQEDWLLLLLWASAWLPARAREARAARMVGLYILGVVGL